MLKICNVLLLITLPLGLAYAQLPIEFFLTMSDGVKLDVTKMVPGTPKPSGGYPAVILIHGLGGSKTDMALLSLLVVPKGYLTLAYSVRGQGNSGGVSTLQSIEFQVSSSEFISLKVYDVLGREVATLVNEKKSPGQYIVTFDNHGASGATLYGSSLASGTYFYQLRTGQSVQTKKMVLIR